MVNCMKTCSIRLLKFMLAGIVFLSLSSKSQAFEANTDEHNIY
jgi:hypothetical protein